MAAARVLTQLLNPQAKSSRDEKQGRLLVTHLYQQVLQPYRTAVGICTREPGWGVNVQTCHSHLHSQTLLAVVQKERQYRFSFLSLVSRNRFMFADVSLTPTSIVVWLNVP